MHYPGNRYGLEGRHFVGLQKTWERIRKRAGLEDVRLHDLRHSFASVAIAGGSSLYLVGKVLGHEQANTTERYAHLADDPLRAVADKTAGQIAAAMGNVGYDLYVRWSFAPYLWRWIEDAALEFSEH